MKNETNLILITFTVNFVRWLIETSQAMETSDSIHTTISAIHLSTFINIYTNILSIDAHQLFAHAKNNEPTPV